MEEHKKRRFNLKKTIFWVAGLFVVFSLVGFLVVPPIAKSILLKKLSDTFHRDISIKSVRVNPYTLSITVRGFVMKGQGGTETFLSFDDLYVNMEIMSLLRRALIIKELKISKPYVNVARKSDGSYNFTDIIQGPSTGKTGQKEPRFIVFSMNNITILNGSIDFFDGPKGEQHTVRDMRISIPFISNRATSANIFVKPEFTATINGDPYSIKGQVKPFAESLETYLDIDIKDLDIPKYVSYIPAKLNFKLPSAAVDLKLRVTYSHGKEKKTSLSVTGDVSLRKFMLDDVTNKPIMRIESLDVGIISLEPFTKMVKLSRVAIRSPDITVIRSENGSFNILGLLPGESQSPQPQVKTTVGQQQNGTQSIVLSMDQLKIEEGKIVFKDLVPSEPVDVSIQKMNLTLEKISTEKGNKGTVDLSFHTGRRGSFTARGTIGAIPLSGELAIDAKSFLIAPFQHYFNDRIKIYITGGSISTAGNVTVASDESGNPSVKFIGNLLVANFSSVDQETANDFLKWKALSFTSVNAGYNPTSLSINGVSISDFYARIIIYQDRTTNLQKVFAAQAAAQEKPDRAEKKEEKEVAQSDKQTPTGVPPDVTIGNITLQGGAIDFTDLHVKPVFSAKLTELGGRISRFILGKNHDSEVEVRGKIDEFVPLQIAGRINPAKDNLLIDLTGVVRDFEMSEMTPYSGKYIGYAIEKGKLSLDLKYSIVKKKLDSQNVIFFDQLTLGEKVESPDAIKAPIRLAIALLKDRSGQIKLDIPVSGSIDDPQFRIGPIIWKIILNLLAKAATAPFALIGALFGGGGEHLSYIEFDDGSAKLTDAALKKIETVTKALHDRPALRLDIEGHVSPEGDKEGLKKYLFTRKVQAQKLNDMVKKRQRAQSVDDVKVEPEEYEKYLTMAYKAEKFAKPRNVIGLAKTLPVSEMEKLMLTNIEITNEDMRQLASRRAQEVKGSILKTDKVEPARVFILEPKSLVPERKENMKDSRVDFILR